jgi:16S rRNA (uracil1498-N3)-methyltransferase
MPIPRFYCPIALAPGRDVVLPETVARHALNVLRLRAGDAVVLFNGEGGEYSGVVSATGRATRVTLRECLDVDLESPLNVTLVQSISSGERMDYTLQKAVELGVTFVQPVVTRRTVVRLEGEKRLRRLAHWQGVVMSACEQCGRAVVPRVGEILQFPDWLGSAGQSPATRYLLDPHGEARIRALAPPTGAVMLLAGPEGGLEPAERDAALAAGFTPLRLGPRILRTETAAVAALAALQAIWGDG